MIGNQHPLFPRTPAGGSRPAPARSPEPAPDLGVPIGSPDGLLAIIPHLLGFVLASSMVIIGMKPRGQVLLTLRYACLIRPVRRTSWASPGTR